MNRTERHQLAQTIARVGGWAEQASALLARRARITEQVSAAAGELRRAVVEVPRDGTPAWQVLPLRGEDDARLGALARAARVPDLTDRAAHYLDQLTGEIPDAVHRARAVLGARRLVSGRARRDAGEQAAAFLDQYEAWGIEHGLAAILAELTPDQDGTRGIGGADALADDVGLARHLALAVAPGQRARLVDGIEVAGLARANAVIARALGDEAGYRAAAARAGERIRRAETRRVLTAMPVARLREATRDRLSITPLTEAGITVVQQVIEHGARLEHVPGIGPTLATRLRGAAQTLWQTTYDEMPVRIDIRHRTEATTELLRRLGAWDATRRLRGATWDLDRARELTGLADALERHPAQLVVFPVAHLSAADLLAGVHAVLARAATVAPTSTAPTSTAPTSTAPSADPWDDFLHRPADYFGMLAELGFAPEDEARTHGDLPEEIVEAVRALSLNTEHLTVGTLRGYQSFGARFALVQRRVILGDEMGLGKTVEALAVLAHLRSQGHHHGLVVCPAAVVTNWVREIAAKSTLRPHRLHGPGRSSAVGDWRRGGGVAVTTYETLGWLSPHLDGVELGCVVVDEAHYIKNPQTKRSGAAAAVLDRAERALLLTGTPLENRLDDFAALVRYVQPGLVVDTSGLSPRLFRRQVAPAYLRRNQEDVLTELPELVEVDEVLPMSGADRAAYRAAVDAGAFMAMRQAAMTAGEHSQKVARLVEIVAEAEANGRRVLVFSHFRGVLDLVARVLPGPVFGPLTGSVPAARRQQVVDEFAAAGHGAVLVAQIVAGGVGLNIQAASVVILCEPQLKPTIEWQAIARAHRMGQVESVQVHRLLSDQGVDQRIGEILARKRALFDDFARESATASSAPEAFDVSEADLAREIVAAERERLFSAANGPDGPGRPASGVGVEVGRADEEDVP
ncbi:DEAD/DEAH box helicase [Frankia canadensis]|nr:DEAD/DEAH box helicase [Frankia canadensis]